MKRPLQFLLALLIGLAAAWSTGPGARIVAAQSPEELQHGVRDIRGTVRSVEGELKQLHVRTDDGRVLRVDMSRVAGVDVRTLQPGDRVHLVGQYFGEPGLFTAFRVGSDGDVARDGGTPEWHRIHGHVQSIEGEIKQVTFKTDDGRILKVDMSRVNPEVQQALTVGEGATVIGHFYGEPNRLTALYIQQDRAEGTRGGAGGQVDPGQWQRIHGTVAAIDGTQLRLRADDGRLLSVEASDVAPDVRAGLRVGEPVTVIGHYRDATSLTARYIQQYPEGSASPKTPRTR